MIYERGEGVPVDLDAALGYYERAIELGAEAKAKRDRVQAKQKRAPLLRALALAAGTVALAAGIYIVKSRRR